MPYPINIGDTVAYTDKYLDRLSRFHPSMPSTQGKVLAFHQLNTGEILADIEWDKPYLPKRVSIKNLNRTIAAFGP